MNNPTALAFSSLGPVSKQNSQLTRAGMVMSMNKITITGVAVAQV
jgi:hypothetical protein